MNQSNSADGWVLVYELMSQNTWDWYQFIQWCQEGKYKTVTLSAYVAVNGDCVFISLLPRPK